MDDFNASQRQSGLLAGGGYPAISIKKLSASINTYWDSIAMGFVFAGFATLREHLRRKNIKPPARFPTATAIAAIAKVYQRVTRIFENVAADRAAVVPAKRA